MFIYRFSILIALCTACHCGCASIFNPDSAIDAAIAAYSSTDQISNDEQPSTGLSDHSAVSDRNDPNSRFQDSLTGVLESQGNSTQPNEKDSGSLYAISEQANGHTGLPRTRSDHQAPDSSSSWDLIEKSLLSSQDSKHDSSFQSLPSGSPQEDRNRPNSSREKTVGGIETFHVENRVVAEPNGKTTELIQIYDRNPIANESEPKRAKAESYLPLIQRSVVPDVDVPKISFDGMFDEEPERFMVSGGVNEDRGINWRDSLEAAGDHLREELKSGQIGKADATQLNVLLEILDSIDGDNRSLVNLVSKMKELKESLPPHHYNALRTVIAKTKGEASSGQQLDDLFRQALDVVSETSDLGIKKAAICNEVNGFGKFNQFESNQFRPGDEFLLYCEIENFSTEDIEGAEGTVHQCEFKAQVEYINSKGETDHVQSLAKITDQSKSDRRDFYILFRIRIPDLAAGDHSLQVQIQDKVGRKSARLDHPIRFHIVE